MLLLNTTLKRTEQPSLEQRGDVMYARHDFVSLFVPATNDSNAMLVARSREPRIAFPTVGVNCRAVAPGSTVSRMKSSRLSAETSLTRFSRIRPITRPVFSAAITTMDFFSISRPRLPSLMRQFQPAWFRGIRIVKN